MRDIKKEVLINRIDNILGNYKNHILTSEEKAFILKVINMLVIK